MNRWTILALVGTLPLMTGCGRISPSKVEESIRTTLATKGVTMKTVTCPSGRPLKQGITFDCTGTDQDGETLVFHVTETDTTGTVSWALDGKILNLRVMGDSIEAKLGKTADVVCPEKTVIMQVHHSVTCDVKMPDKTHQVVLTLTDAKGNVAWKMLD